MIPAIILSGVSISLMLIVLNIGSNASIKTKKPNASYQMQFALFIAVANFLFYFLGVWATKLLYGFMELKDLVIVFIMLMLCIKTIINSFNYKKEDNFYNLSVMPVRIMLATATGINSFLCGIALNLGGFDDLKTALLTSLTVFVGAFLGSSLKKSAYKVLKLRPELLGSVLFLLIGIIYLFKYLGKISFY